MNSNVLAVILVASILLVSGTIAYAYAKSHDGLPHTSGNGGYPGSPIHGGMMGGHAGASHRAGEPCMDEAAEARGSSGHGRHGGDHGHREWGMHGYMVENMEGGAPNLTTITGTVVSVDASHNTLTIDTGDGNISVVFMRVYVDNETGALTFGPWILGGIQEGSQITVAVPENTSRGTLALPAFSIVVDGGSYVSPRLYGSTCMQGRG